MTTPTPDFWRNRRVLVTGHTGFKGAWLCAWLERLGAEVHAFALEPEPGLNLFRDLGDWRGLSSTIGDIRDRAAIGAACVEANPEVAIHMAAQSLVRRAHRDPAGTYSTNVQGTGNLLEALSQCQGLRTVLVVTSDKCYRNDDSGRPFVETDPLGGDEPYSASKAAQETIAAGWRRGIYGGRPDGTLLATARAGNVIGGGDWSEDRILPDFFRAADAGKPLTVRNPEATRPWQHVLDVLSGYLAYIEALTGSAGRELPPALNFGPDTSEAKPVRWLVDRATTTLRDAGISVPDWEHVPDGGPREAANLALDAGLALKTIGWKPGLTQADAIDWTAAWHAKVGTGATPREAVTAQIDSYTKLAA